MGATRIADIDIAGIVSKKTYTSSPAAWEDLVFYFLMVDRFSDGNETGYLDNQGAKATGKGTPMFSIEQANNIPRDKWVANGQGWKGGNLK